jgi:hypothetical protein
MLFLQVGVFTLGMLGPLRRQVSLQCFGALLCRLCASGQLPDTLLYALAVLFLLGISVPCFIASAMLAVVILDTGVIKLVKVVDIPFLLKAVFFSAEAIMVSVIHFSNSHRVKLLR